MSSDAGELPDDMLELVDSLRTQAVIKAGTANADRRGMSRFGDRVKRNTRQNWPSMALVVAAALASVLFGPFIGLAAALGAWGLYEYRRRQVQD